MANSYTLCSRWTDALFQAKPGVNLIGSTGVLTWMQWLNKWAEHCKVEASYRVATPTEFASKLAGLSDAVIEELAFIEEFGFAGGNPEAVLPDDVSSYQRTCWRSQWC